MYQVKEQTMEQLNKWAGTLKVVVNELSIMKVEGSETLKEGMKSDFDDHMYERRYCWSPSENPELDLPDISDGEDIEVS